MPAYIKDVDRVKACLWCGATIHWQLRDGRKSWAQRKYCSKTCVDDARRGHEDDAFWLRVSPEPNAGCWYWVGADKGGKGYGYFARAKMLAHHYAYLKFNGPIPEGLFVCHTCDVPCCVNPQHLFTGTHIENVQDCMAKQRHCIGERNGGGGKLTASKVRQIRSLYTRGATRQVDLAEQFGVTQVMISRIILRTSWEHLE